MLFSFKSAMAKPTILLSISQTQPFPRSVINSLQSSSVTKLGSDKAFSVTEFLTICICFMSSIVASLKIIFSNIGKLLTKLYRTRLFSAELDFVYFIGFVII